MKKMEKAKFLPLMLAIVTLTACGSTATQEKIEESDSVRYITPTVDNGKISIDLDTLSEHALYVNYDSDGINIQMIAVNASDGSSRLSLNTCQACNPSPKAFFMECDGKLVCQNCGNIFTMDSVGIAAGGCNPMNISYEIVNGNLNVNVADLDNYADAFSSLDGPVE